MKNLIAVFAVLGLATGVAVAEDPANTDTTEATEAVAPPATPDCSSLEGAAKTECEKAAEPKAEEPPKSGKQMEKSDDGKMEAFDEDE